MFHVKQLLFFSFVFIGTSLCAQGVLTLHDKPFENKVRVDSGLYKQISEFPAFAHLSQTEKESLYWVNYFRQDPRRFWNTIMKEFLVQFPEAQSDYTRSLEKDLFKAPQGLQLLMPDSGLVRMAFRHSTDLKKRNGIISHISSTGQNFVQRIQASGKYSCGAENIFNGGFNALGALIALLIDQGVLDKGHRINLLDPKFQLVGISFISFSLGRGILVQDFACR